VSKIATPSRGIYVNYRWGSERGMILVAGSKAEKHQDPDGDYFTVYVSGWLVRDGFDSCRWVKDIEHTSSVDDYEEQWIHPAVDPEYQ